MITLTAILVQRVSSERLGVGDSPVYISVEASDAQFLTLPELSVEFIKAADADSIEIDNVAMRRATLEDVFLQTTGRSFRDA